MISPVLAPESQFATIAELAFHHFAREGSGGMGLPIKDRHLTTGGSVVSQDGRKANG